ncbi:MAG: hypothetical protein QOG64_456 [Acidimicrobiaceae bacterium]|nr:hypothetical protein [Acidimicrobiaceae bacterium]
MLAVYLFLPIVVLGAFAVAAAIRGATAEAARLGEAVDGMNRLQPALVEVRSEAERTRRAFQQLRNR